MQELRKDPIVGRWVIIAKNRAQRPHDLVEAAHVPSSAGACPFCEGNEAETPHEITAVRAQGTARDAPGWSVRVVPNRYPALAMHGELGQRASGLYEMMSGVGAHEVVIESPRHVRSITELSDQHAADVLAIYRDRLRELKQDSRLRYGMIFKNVGAAAGASLEHAHSQIIVTPIVPISVLEELEGSRQLYERHQKCAFCEMIAQERALGQRVVCETGSYIAFCPFAARFPFETWILPREHESHFESLSRSACDELGLILKRVLGKIERALDRPAYNYIVHTAPFDTSSLTHYHWHIEVIPRVTKTAGFEWGSGFYINPAPPEEAAAFLRELDGG